MALAPYDDSGHKALVGFFYQTAMSVDLVLTLEQDLERDPLGGHRMMSFVRPEEFGQDALAGPSATLVQHKYSENPDSHKIKPAELYDIFTKLHAASQRVQSTYNCTPSCLLQTNRPLSFRSKKILEAAKSGQTYKYLDTTTEYKDAKKRICYPGRTCAINIAYRSFLKALNFDPRSFANAIDALRTRAHGFGILDNEVSERVRTIVGAVFEGTTRTVGRDFRISDLDRLLTGDAAPRLLACEAVSHAMRTEITNGSHSFSHLPPLYSREVTKALQEAYTEPVIHLYGEGGAGKSALAFTYLESLVKPTPPPFVGGCHITRLDKHWTGGLFGQWRNTYNEDLRRQPVATLISRLATAAPSYSSPLMVVVVDGLDERDTHQDRHPLDILLEFVEGERQRTIATGACPRLQLIVTSRRLDELSQYWIDDPYDRYSSRLCRIHIRIYSDDELTDIASKYFRQDFAQRIRESLRLKGNTPRPGHSSFPEPSERGHSFRPVAMPTLEALRHPPLIAALRELLPSEAMAVLDDDFAACTKVATFYLRWFVKKVQRRAVMRRAEAINWVLDKVSKQAGTSGQVFQYREDWENPITACGGAPLDALCVFDEACSAGLVLRAGDERWQWRNAFVCLGIQGLLRSRTGETQ